MKRRIRRLTVHVWLRFVYGCLGFLRVCVGSLFACRPLYGVAFFSRALVAAAQMKRRIRRLVAEAEQDRLAAEAGTDVELVGPQ